MSTTVMPFKIFIAKTKNILTAASSAKLFDRDGNPVVSMTERPIISKSVCTEMDEALYCAAMGIETAADAEKFTQAHPSMRFGFFGQPGIQIAEIDSLQRYYESVAKAVVQFHDFRKFIDFQEKYLNLKHAGICEDRTGNRDELRHEIVRIYASHFSLLNRSTSWSSFEDMVDTYYETHNVVDKVSEDYLNRDEWDNRTYQDLLDEYFEDNPSHWEPHQSSVWAQVDEIIDSIMFRDVSDYFLKVSSEATILYNPETITIEYYCPDVLTAMYMMANVALFNMDRYEQCAEKNCRTYFKVGKRYHQTRCEKHMGPRRTKRQNARAKEKELEENAFECEE